MQILYVHGKGGTAQEAEHYQKLFPADEVIGLDYQTCSPWETGNLRNIMNFGEETFELKVLNTGQVVHSMRELLPIAIEYV